MTSKIVDWLFKLNAEVSLGKLEADWHRAWRMGHREKAGKLKVRKG